MGPLLAKLKIVEQSELFEGFIDIEILQPNFYIVNWHVEFFLEKG